MITEKSVFQALNNVMDPELGIDIVNLGFIYDVKIVDNEVAVVMTLTTKGCPLHSSLKRQAEEAILEKTGASKVEVIVVFDPPWNPSMLSEMAKQKLGISE